MPTFNYTVDDEPQSTQQHELTPTQILQQAGIDPATHYLKEIQGDHEVSFENDPNTPIHMHEHLKFISIFTGETPVS